MEDQFTVPEDYEIAFRRILPYLTAPLQKEPQVLASLLLYLKLGGEKMARIAIDALNVTQRLRDAEIRKQQREQELLNEGNLNGEEEDEDEDDVKSDEDYDGDDGDDGE